MINLEVIDTRKKWPKMTIDKALFTLHNLTNFCINSTGIITENTNTHDLLFFLLRLSKTFDKTTEIMRFLQRIYIF